MLILSGGEAEVEGPCQTGMDARVANGFTGFPTRYFDCGFASAADRITPDRVLPCDSVPQCELLYFATGL